MNILKSLSRIGTRFLYTPTANAVVCSRCFQQQVSMWRVMPVQAFHRSFPLCTRDSTAVKETQQRQEIQQENEELDKLYKMVELEVRGYEKATLNSYMTFVKMAAAQLGITIGKCWIPQKARHFRLSVLKSVHIYKKHQVQYEVRTYFLIMQFHRLTGSTADTFLEYIQRNLSEGLAMKVTKVSLEKLPEYLVPPVGRQSEGLLNSTSGERDRRWARSGCCEPGKRRGELTVESNSEKTVTPLSESRLDESLAPPAESRSDKSLIPPAESRSEESLTPPTENRSDESLTLPTESMSDESATSPAISKLVETASSPATSKSDESSTSPAASKTE